MHRIIAGALALCLWAGAALAQEAAALARLEAGRLADDGPGAVLELELSQGVPWRVFTLDAPRRVVLDFREVDWGAATAADFGTSAQVSALRMGAFQPGWSRMVLDLAAPLSVAQAELAMTPGTGRARLALRLDPVTPAAFAAEAGTPEAAAWPAAAVAPRPQPKARRADGKLMVVLDPGHGGIDPGAERGGQTEAGLMLVFARELAEALRRTGHYEVALTRDADVFVSLEARVALAHDAGADLFVSLHADAIEEGVAHGAAVYTLSAEASDAASAALAERHDRDDLLAGLDLSGSDDRIANVLMELARVDNGPRSRALATGLVGGIRGAIGQVHKRPLRQASFSVLKAADIPSVLIELAFLSTEEDLENLQDPAWRAGMAAGIRDGIEAWALEDAALARLRRR